MKILLVYHHDLIRDSLSELLNTFDNVEQVQAISSGSQIIKKIKEMNPTIIITQLGLPEVGGLEVTRRVTNIYPEIKTVIIMDRQYEVIPSSFMRSGAVGFLTLNTSRANFKQALNTVNNDQYYIDHDIGHKIAMTSIKSEDNIFDQLSLRETQVMLLLAVGMKISNISASLNLSPKTISTYKYRLFHKLEVGSEVELAKLATEHGLVEANVSLIQQSLEKAAVSA